MLVVVFSVQTQLASSPFFTSDRHRMGNESLSSCKNTSKNVLFFDSSQRDRDDEKRRTNEVITASQLQLTGESVWHFYRHFVNNIPRDYLLLFLAGLSDKAKNPPS